jgi:hypothetical protein
MPFLQRIVSARMNLVLLDHSMLTIVLGWRHLDATFGVLVRRLPGQQISRRDAPDAMHGAKRIEHPNL